MKNNFEFGQYIKVFEADLAPKLWMEEQQALEDIPCRQKCDLNEKCNSYIHKKGYSKRCILIQTNTDEGL